jgi:CRISPR-associated protein Cas2
MRYVITSDVADNQRREDVATLLSGYGPRLQLSVFKCEVPSRREAAALRAKLRDLIEPAEDQIRLSFGLGAAGKGPEMRAPRWRPTSTL